MDFSTIDLAANADRGADCHIEHPITGEPLYVEGKPVIIRLLGQDSREFRAAISQLSEKAGKGKASLEKAEANAVELLTRLVVKWDNIIWEGAPLECTAENIRMFLTKFPPIRRQIDEFVAERANFLQRGGKK